MRPLKATRRRRFLFHRTKSGVYVGELVADGPAAREGTLQRGDHIMVVNGVDVRSATQEVVAQLLKVSLISTLIVHRHDLNK